MLDKNFVKMKVEYIQRDLNHLEPNEHIIAERGGEKLKAPLQYRETFLRLAKMRILPEDFAQEIAKSAGFRNAIVHDYNNIDKYITYQSVKDAIAQYARYCDYILKFIC